MVLQQVPVHRGLREVGAHGRRTQHAVPLGRNHSIWSETAVHSRLAVSPVVLFKLEERGANTHSSLFINGDGDGCRPDCCTKLKQLPAD